MNTLSFIVLLLFGCAEAEPPASKSSSTIGGSCSYSNDAGVLGCMEYGSGSSVELMKKDCTSGYPTAVFQESSSCSSTLKTKNKCVLSGSSNSVDQTIYGSAMTSTVCLSQGGVFTDGSVNVKTSASCLYYQGATLMACMEFWDVNEDLLPMFKDYCDNSSIPNSTPSWSSSSACPSEAKSWGTCLEKVGELDVDTRSYGFDEASCTGTYTP